MTHPLLVELHDDLLAADALRPRSVQREPGASDTYGCRAALLLRARGVSHSDPRLGWQAFVGSAIDQAIGAVRGDAQVRLVYRDVPATIDELRPPVVRDWKTVGTAGDVLRRKVDGPRPKHVAQVMLGAAAAIDAGHDITTVQLVYLPRDGELLDGWVWEADFDRETADAAADWHHALSDTITARADLEVPDALDGLRDEPLTFCRRFCPHVTTCRGVDDLIPLDDPGLIEAAEEHLHGATLIDEGKARQAKARPVLLGLSGRVGSVEVRTYGGGSKEVEVEDVDALRQLWTFIRDEPPPTRTEIRTSAVRLTVKEAR